MASFMGKDVWWAVPAAVVLGVPMYTNAAGIIPIVEALIGKGAAQSWQLDNRGATMIEDRIEFGFAVDWMRKDLRITLDAARENGASLPLTAQVDQYYADVQAMGGHRWDTSSLIARLNRKPD